MPNKHPQLLTSGRMADLLGVSSARVQHILSTRLDLAPSAYAGNTRLYDRKVLARIRHELSAIAARREQEN